MIGSRKPAAKRLSLDGDAHRRLDQRNDASFVEAERQGLMLAAKVRTLALCVVMVWVAVDTRSHGLSFLYEISQVAIFAILGLFQFYCAKDGLLGRPAKYVFVAIDCALLALVTSSQGPFSEIDMPPAILMNGSQFSYFYLFLMQAAFSFRPSLVLWCGLCIIVARTGMLVWFLHFPDTFSNLDLTEQSVEGFLEARADPNFIYLGFWAQEIIVCLLVTVGLATVVRRSRQLVESRITTEKSRASLARYFSPNVVDRLSTSEGKLATAREQNVAVMFVDVVGFTTMCEHDTPNDVIAFLREYHDRLGKAVFENGGTLDKYIGDGLMATFGTPEPDPDDAQNALNCAFKMLESLKNWNDERNANGLLPVQVGIGVHFGPVIAGDIGNQRRLEYSVIGDTVNVASRLETLTRGLKTPLAVSDDLINSITQTSKAIQPLKSNLKYIGMQDLRGKREQIGVWIYNSINTQCDATAS